MQFDLRTLATVVGGRLDGPPDLVVSGVAGILEAKPGDLTFLAQRRYLAQLSRTQASAIIARDDLETSLPAIRVDDPYLAFLRAIEAFARPVTEVFAPGIHSSAVIHETARLGEGVRLGPHVVVGQGCEIGDHTIVGAGSVLMPEAEVGSHCLIYPQVVVREDCRIGDRVILHPGVVVGSDGFGFAKGEGIYHKIPQIGRVIIEDDVEIGANSCIDRATTGRTIIAAGTKLDNLVQIAHNVSVGRHCVISAQSGVSGSSTIGDDVTIAGQVGIADHLRIGNRVQIGGKSGVSGHVPDDSAYSGIPARDHREWRRLNVHTSRLARYAQEISELRQRLEELEKAHRASSTTNR
jgi:UDP-3-O-[3-hydroxymyristoyl] glucosamine N-acyltransferase